MKTCEFPQFMKIKEDISLRKMPSGGLMAGAVISD
jgi:hypothetical protein